MRRLLILAMLTAAFGCEGPPLPVSEPDQCLRSDLFKQCMELLPAGPNDTKYNDWAEVVAECGSVAYYQSLRRLDRIKAECRYR